MKTVVIGLGTVGRALASMLRRKHEVLVRDVEPGSPAQPVDVVNICFPYSDEFEGAAVNYVHEYFPKAAIIHSTVPVGVTRRVASQCSKEIEFVHSPVNGLHHEMLHSLVEFPKMVGGLDKGVSGLAMAFLREAGFACVPFPTAEDTELAKLLCTLRFGLDIAFEKQVKKLCEDLGADFRWVYTEWTDRYNEGYERLHHHEFRRPLIAHVPGPIGGTCVIPNARLLMATRFFAPADHLLEFNATLEEKEAPRYGERRQDAGKLPASQASPAFGD